MTPVGIVLMSVMFLQQGRTEAPACLAALNFVKCTLAATFQAQAVPSTCRAGLPAERIGCGEDKA